MKHSPFLTYVPQCSLQHAVQKPKLFKAFNWISCRAENQTFIKHFHFSVFAVCKSVRPDSVKPAYKLGRSFCPEYRVNKYDCICRIDFLVLCKNVCSNCRRSPVKETAGRSSFTLRTCCDPGKRKTLQL